MRRTESVHVLGLKKRRDVARKLASRAKSRYGELKRRRSRPPLEQLILSILWRCTSTRRASRALKALEDTFVDWNEVRVSTVGEVAAVLSSSEWTAPCAERIIGVMRSLFDIHNMVSLDPLTELTPAQSRSFLQSLPGMGRDIADEVLLFSFQSEVLPLSEDTARLCYRLGLIRNERASQDSQKELMALWPPELYAPLTLFFIDHARGVCRFDKPRCKECSVKQDCIKQDV